MDQMTQLRLIWLAGLAVVFGLGVALVWILTRLAELRERRGSRPLGAVRAHPGSTGVATRRPSTLDGRSDASRNAA